MDTAIQTVARGPLSGFLWRWLGAWMLAPALSSLLLAVYDAIGRHGFDSTAYVAIVGLLSLPALGGLLHGIIMRGLLQRSTLWGALTGGGIVIAAVSIVATVSFRELWWAWDNRIAVWVAEALGLASLPHAFVGVVSASFLFGLVLGAVQAVALAPRWRSVSAWIATTAVAAVLAGLWFYVCVTAGPIKALFVRMAESMLFAGQWRYLPVSILGAEVGALCFALPTGLLMQRLLRRHQRADDEALVRRFEWFALKKSLAIRRRRTMSE